MNYSISTSILINASKQKVWEALTDLQNYPLWNPFIKSAVGSLEKGNTLKIQIHPPKGSAMKFSPKVMDLDQGVSFSWWGHFLMPGIFDGHHQFKLEETADGEVMLTHSESFKGILVPLMKKDLETKVRAGFEQMNSALKVLVEK